MIGHPEYLEATARQLNVFPMYEELIQKYPQFLYWSASHEVELHHYGIGGLIQHTREVVETGLTIIPTLHLDGKVDRSEYFLAALYHDSGKMFDYQYVEPIGQFHKTSHRRLIHHLPRSVLIFHDAIRLFPEMETIYHDRIVHDILAHHGQREYGSPVAPKTHCAWLLHLADSMSARLNDCDRHDVVSRQ